MAEVLNLKVISSKMNIDKTICSMFAICKGSRILEEYEILKEVLEISSIRNISRASVKIVFRRRVEYHIKKTFLQVFISEIYLNFYFLINKLYFRLLLSLCLDICLFILTSIILLTERWLY